MTRSLTRAGLGMTMAAGAPLGWLGMRWLAGSELGVELTTQPGLYLYMLVGTMAAFAIFGMLLGEREDRLLASNARLEDLSLTGSLTGLRNGRYFHAPLDEEFSEWGPTGDPLAVVLLDLDHFKRINGTYGHPAGDDVTARELYGAADAALYRAKQEGRDRTVVAGRRSPNNPAVSSW